MIKANFEFISDLQYKIKALEARVHAFESGAAFTSIKVTFEKLLASKDREICKMKSALADAHAHAATMRHKWMQVFDDLQEEHAKALAGKDREIRAMEERALSAERQRDEAKDKLRDKVKECYQIQTELEEAQSKMQKLIAQKNRDNENSSMPSSQVANRKTLKNSREKSGKSPGAQPGHVGHRRRKLEPTSRVSISVPDRFADSSRFKPTGRIITKQVIGIQVSISVTEYFTPEFRNVLTGQRVHAAFPAGVDNEVNYDGSIKALAFLLNNYYNVATEKVVELFSELTGGQLQLSKGLVNGLSKEFSRRSEKITKAAIDALLESPVVHVDFTPVRVNGKKMQVLVCATSKQVLFFIREHKGHKGINGTPVEHIVSILVHDHEISFYSYGINHQECLEHVLRYLVSSMENERNLSWNKLMWELIREMIHFRNGLHPNEVRNPDVVDPEQVLQFEARYDDILITAAREYEYEPPGKYNRDGFNLAKRLGEFRDNHLLFLHDIRVPPTNNNAERPIRRLKRKQAQAMTFRSFAGVDYLCQSLGIVDLLRNKEQSLYLEIVDIFNLSASN